MKRTQRALSFLCCFIIALGVVTAPFHAHAISLSELMNSDVSGWVNNSTSNTWNNVDNSNTNYTVNKPQNYYTKVTNTTVDASGNVTNYLCGSWLN